MTLTELKYIVAVARDATAAFDERRAMRKKIAELEAAL